MNNNKKIAHLIAPSGYVETKNLNIIKKNLKTLGFNNIIYSKNIIERDHDYAGSIDRRTIEIINAYCSEANIIFSVIGGMGAVHLLPYLDYKLIKNANKKILGSSDMTILLNAIYQKTGTECYHGPNLGKDIKLHVKTIDCLKRIIDCKGYRVRIKKEDILVNGMTEARIVGGNIELLGRSLGTDYEIDTVNKILFLEEFDMKSWRVNDILFQLKLAGKFDHVKGIILGHFLLCGEDINHYLDRFFKKFKVPVIINQPIGHDEPNLTIPIGKKCMIDCNKGFWEIMFK